MRCTHRLTGHRRHSWHGIHSGSRGFQLALGIDEKVSGCDDPFPGLQPREDLNAPCIALTRGHLARLKEAAAAFDKYSFSHAGIKNRFYRDGELRGNIDSKLDVR